MRCLFVYFNRYYRPRTNLSIALLETILKQEGHQTEIFDVSFYPEFLPDWERNSIANGNHKVVDNLTIAPKSTSPYHDLIQAVTKFNPQLIGFTYYKEQEAMQDALLTPLKLAFPEIKLLAGGPQVCVNPEESLKQAYIDMICYGEGETLIKDLAAKIERGESYDHLAGLWLKTESGIIRNGIASLTDLDTLPIPDWDSFASVQINGLYEGKAYRMGHVEFTRGCPFNCSYCGTGSVRGAYKADGQHNFVRHKKPSLAVKEFKALKEKYGLEMFYFVSGTFTAMPKDILEELAHLYRKEVNLPFIALVHPNTIDKRTAELLSLMGCVHVSIGVESGVAEFRERVFNRHMSDEQIINAIHWLREARIHVTTFNIIGVPGMDRKHVFKTIELNRKCNPDSAIVAMFIPFPDNDLTRSLVRQGLIDPAKIVVSDGNVFAVDIPEMSRSEIMGLYNTFSLYILAPRWSFPIIRLLEKSNRLTDAIRSFWIKRLRS